MLVYLICIITKLCTYYKKIDMNINSILHVCTYPVWNAQIFQNCISNNKVHINSKVLAQTVVNEITHEVDDIMIVFNSFTAENDSEKMMLSMKDS